MKTRIDIATAERVRPLRTRLSKWGFWALSLAAVAAGAYVSYRYWPARPGAVRISFVATFVLLYLLKEVYRRLRVRKIRRQRFSGGKPYFWDLGMRQKTDLPACDQFFGALTGLRCNRPVLLLVEKLSEADHMTVLYDIFKDRLRATGCNVVRYYHQGDLRVFWNEEAPSGRSISELAASYGKFALIIGGNAHRAFNVDSDDLHDWAEDFRTWERKWALTYAPVASWGECEAKLATFLTVIPFTEQGLAVLGDQLRNKTGASAVRFARDDFPFSRVSWDADLIPELERHFGRPVAQWIAAGAVCSRIEPGLTLRLGAVIPAETGEVLTCGNLLKIARLDWFRTGKMPDDVRGNLIAGLPLSLRDRVRQEVVATMEEHPPRAPSHAVNDFRMELAGLKLMLPGYADAAIRNELYELRTMGYQEDVGLADWIEGQKSWIERLIPRSMDRYVYREGAYLLGWSNWLVIPIFLLVSAGAAYVPLEVSPPASTFNMEFEVRSTEGQPLADAEIAIFDEEEPRGGITNDGGRWLGELPGNWQGESRRITVSRPGYEVLETERRLQPPGEVLILKPVAPTQRDAVQISGRVMAVDGTPLAGATVRLDGAVVRSGNGGYFVIERERPLERAAPLQAEKTEYFDRTMTLSPADAPPVIYLTPKTLRGRIYDAATNRGLPEVSITGSGIRQTTGPDGSFTIQLPDAYRQASAVSLNLAKEGYLTKTEEATLASTTVSFYMQKEEERFLMGKVTDADHGRPVPAAEVTLQPQRERAVTDAGGNFRFRLNPGDSRDRFVIDLKGEGYQSREGVRVGHNETITLTRSTRFIRGQVIDESGAGIRNAWFRAPGIDDAGDADASGRFEIEVRSRYEADRVRVHFGRAGYLETAVDLVVGSDNNRIRLLAGSNRIRITGVLQDACTGKNISGVGIQAVADRQYERSVHRNIGSFTYELELPSAYSGSINLTFDTDSHYSHTEVIRSPFPAQVNLGRIMLRTHTLYGRVTDQQGVGLSGVYVTMAQPQGAATSGSDGRFQILLPQNYTGCEATLRAANRNGYTATGTVTAVFGEEARIVMQREPEPVREFVISGNVFNSVTGEALQDVWIYAEGRRLVSTKPGTNVFETSVGVNHILYNALSAGRSVKLRAEKENYIAGEATWQVGQRPVTFRLQPEIRGIELIPLFIKNTLIIRVSIYNKPAAKQKVQVFDYRGGNELGSGVTDERGEVRIQGQFKAGQKIYLEVPAFRIENISPRGGGDRVVPENLTIELFYGN